MHNYVILLVAIAFGVKIGYTYYINLCERSGKMAQKPNHFSEHNNQHNALSRLLEAFIKLLESGTVYDFFYYVGMVFLRSFYKIYKDAYRKVLNFTLKYRKILASHLSVFLNNATNVLAEFLNAVFFIFTLPVRFFVRLGKAYKVGGIVGMFGAARNILKNGYAAFFKEIRVVLCYAAPLVAFVFLLNTISGFTSSQYVLAINYQGQLVGYVSNEGVYNEAERLMQDRIIYNDKEKQYAFTPDIEVTTLSNVTKLSDEYELCNKMIEASGAVIREAYGLYVDGEFYGATTDGATLAQVLEGMLDEYATGAEGEIVSFLNDVQVKDGLYPETSIVDCSVLEKLVLSDIEGQRTYVVQSGDAPTLIAQKNGIPYSTFKALNPDIEEVCMPGQVVIISNSKPFLAVKTSYIETVEVDVDYKIISSNSNKYSKGTTKVVVSGKKGKALQTAEKVYIDGVLSTTNVISTVVTKQPVNREIIIGTYVNTTASTGSGTYSGKFIWPVDGGYVSCHINGYKGHTGMDIAAAKGTNIRASLSGRVITVKKLTYGYGYHIIIDHGNGVQTLYAHCSKLLVELGEYVEQGEIIAKVGSTGNSTGPHCHFEIRINKKYMNPANYIGSKYNR